MENKTIESLEKLVKIKDETIKELEKQIELLKNKAQPSLPYYPLQPIQTPIVNPINPYSPQPNPFGLPPYIITSIYGMDTVSITPTNNTNSNITYIQKTGI